MTEQPSTSKHWWTSQAHYGLALLPATLTARPAAPRWVRWTFPIALATALVSITLLFCPGFLSGEQPLLILFVVPILLSAYLVGWRTGLIAERNRARQTLRDTEIRLQRFYDSGLFGVIYWNTDGQITDANDTFLQMVGYDRADLAAGRMNWIRMTPPEYRQLDQLSLAGLQATGANMKPLEKEYLRKDGTRLPILLAAAMLDEKRSTGVAFVLDFTERKHAEQIVRESQQRILELTRNIHGGLWEATVTGRPGWDDLTVEPTLDKALFDWDLQFINEEAARRVMDIPEIPGEPFGWAMYRARASSQLKMDLISRQALLDKAPGYQQEFAIRDRAGRIKHLHEAVSIHPLEYGRWCLYGVVTDITDRKLAEDAMAAAKISAEQARADAEAACKARDHFIAVLSHELRNPLNPVLATTTMLREDPRFDADTREQLEVIYRNAELEARLIDDLLDVTRIARGKVELHPQPVPLSSILRQAVEVCRPDLQARQLRFSCDAPDQTCWVHADAARLQQVFWNLLNNAIKFTPVGGSIALRVRPLHDSRQALVEVTDTGVGIEPDALQRIFSPFEQEQRGTTRQFGGLGLGLAISKAMVELHGGAISAHSPGKGQGATFQVRLPLTDAPITPATETPPDLGETTAPAEPLHTLRILLVEDHGDTARIMGRLLRAQGHTVSHAPDVATALQLADQQSFDLLLSDLGLPDGSGLDIMRALRARGSDLPGIAVSGYGQEQDVQRSRDAGFTAHITKPVNFHAVESTMRQVVNQRLAPHVA